jgi:hypothetical protein
MSIILPRAPSEAEYYLEHEDVMTQTIMAEIPVTLTQAPKKNKQQAPQEAIDEFWSKFTTKTPGKGLWYYPMASSMRLRTETNVLLLRSDKGYTF